MALACARGWCPLLGVVVAVAPWRGAAAATPAPTPFRGRAPRAAVAAGTRTLHMVYFDVARGLRYARLGPTGWSASAGAVRPVRCAISRARVSRSLSRGTTMSTIPWSRRYSAR